MLPNRARFQINSWDVKGPLYVKVNEKCWKVAEEKPTLFASNRRCFFFNSGHPKNGYLLSAKLQHFQDTWALSKSSDRYTQLQINEHQNISKAPSGKAEDQEKSVQSWKSLKSCIPRRRLTPDYAAFYHKFSSWLLNVPALPTQEMRAKFWCYKALSRETNQAAMPCVTWRLVPNIYELEDQGLHINISVSQVWLSWLQALRVTSIHTMPASQSDPEMWETQTCWWFRNPVIGTKRIPPRKSNMSSWKITILNRRDIFIHGCLSIVVLVYQCVYFQPKKLFTA